MAIAVIAGNTPSAFALLSWHILVQVLNMKPPEILGMLEEAAGTRMYESKKEAALKTLEKKQVKVEEINKVCHSSTLGSVLHGFVCKGLLCCEESLQLFKCIQQRQILKTCKICRCMAHGCVLILCH